MLLYTTAVCRVRKGGTHLVSKCVRLCVCIRAVCCVFMGVCVCLCTSGGRTGGRRVKLVHGVLVYVRRQAEEDAAAQHEDGGAPAEAVAPVKLVVGLQHRPVDELDGVEDQSAGLQHHCHQNRDRQKFLIQKEGCFLFCFFRAGRVLFSKSDNHRQKTHIIKRELLLNLILQKH